jgi:hypothetical protein
VAASFSETAPAIHEAAIRYLGFESHYHPELDD